MEVIDMSSVTFIPEHQPDFPRLIATFVPMQWGGETEVGFYAQPIEGAASADFDITLEVLKWGRVVSRDQLEGPRASILGPRNLQHAGSAPLWVQKWVGPTRFDLSMTCEEFWKEVDNFLAQNVGWDPNGGKMRPDIPAEVYRVLEEERLHTTKESTNIIDAPVDLEALKKEHADMQQALNYIAFLTGPGCVFVPENTGYVAAEVARKVIGDMVKERNKAVSLSPQFKR
jgi:hypothetical protein